MIQHYSITSTGTLSDRYALTNGLPKGIKPIQKTKPAELLPVVVVDTNGTRVERMKWGVFTKGAKNANSVFRYKTFSVRSEDVFKKPMYAHVIRSQRCIVPADGFYYDISSSDGKKTYYITKASGSLLSLGGVYSEWEDQDGTTWQTFSIITTTANKDMRAIDSRMPVILPKDKEAAWLDGTVNDMTSLYDMMRPYAPYTLTINDVSGK